MPGQATTSLHRSRWLSGKHVGNSRPILRAFVRKGALHRHYERLPDKDVFSFIPGLKGPNWVWQAEWKANSDYNEIPNVKEVRGDQDYDQNGVQQVTMTIDNIGMIQEEGAMGALFHQIERGWYAPLRGNKPPLTGGQRVGGSKNGWFDRWKDKATQVMIVCGYGEAVFPIFLGLVDNVTLTSSPDQIVVTLRDMGQFLTDQHTFMDAKNLFVKDPITFCDRQKADERHNQAVSANVKNQKPGNPPRLAIDDSKESACLSAEYEGSNGLWWIDVPLPKGRYEDFNLMPAYDGLTVKVSVYATNVNLTKEADGSVEARGTDGTIYGQGWIPGGDEVDEGIHSVAEFTAKQGNTNYGIRSGGGGYVLGEGSKLRLWFTDLKKTDNDSGRGWCWRAGVANLEVFSRSRIEAAKTENWILVDDVSDIIKTVLQWVGLTEWEVETCGVRLKDKIVFDRQTYLIDIINRIKELTSYVFFIRPPLEFDIDNLAKGNEANLSMGIAVFREGSSMQSQPPQSVEQIKDTQLLTAVQATFDANQLPNSIRVRGKALGAKQASPNAHVLGGDPAVRYQYSYRPVWATADGENAGQAHLRRQEVHYDNLLASVYECKVACLLIAFRCALESAKAEIEFPLWPEIYLDDQVLLFDTGTGLSTRLWVTNRSWNYSSGEQVVFKMNLGGALLDTNDAAETQAQLEAVLAEENRNPGKIARGPWENVHKF